MSAARRKILFVAEAVTLAHVARPWVLARSLPPDRYEVVFATHPRYDRLFPDPPFRRVAIESVTPDHFLGALARGRPPYDKRILENYVEEEEALLVRERPDLVVGDFRLSLPLSCKAAGVPHWAIANAYWSPWADPHYPMPEHLLARLLGPRLAEAIFNRIAPLVFGAYTAPFNALCRARGLPGVGRDLRRYYTYADQVLYADLPELVPLKGAPPSHHFIGPPAWSPQVELPDWWGEALAAERPLIYFTPGSSGLEAILPQVIEALARLPVTLVVASAGGKLPSSPPANLYAAPWLPGDQVARRAALVICNGGSPTTYQALAAGAPVLGIPANLDQYLNMKHLQAAGAGLTLRSGTLRPQAVVAAVERLLDEPEFTAAARRFQAILERQDAGVRFLELVEAL